MKKISRIKFILILIFSITQISFPQQKKIIRIIDSNLFELQNGDIIKLAGVDAPRKNHPDYALRQVADKAIQYAKQELLNRRFTIILLDNSPEDSVYKLAYVIKEYPFGDKDFSKTFLENGFGKIINNVDSLHFTKYKLAEEKAKEDNKGVWKYFNVSDTLKLDREYLPGENENGIYGDSLQYLYVTYQPPTAWHITSELLVGPTSGVIASIPAGLICLGAYAVAGGEGLGGIVPFIFGMHLGYLAGNSLGIYLIANTTNKKVTYWGTFASSVIGAAVGYGILALSNDRAYYFPFNFDSKAGYENLIPFILPAVSAVVYSNFLAGDKYNPITNTGYPEAFNSYTHKDLYNNQLLFNINLIHLSF